MSDRHVRGQFHGARRLVGRDEHEGRSIAHAFHRPRHSLALIFGQKRLACGGEDTRLRTLHGFQVQQEHEIARLQ